MGSGPFGTIFQPNHRAPPKCPTTTRVRAYSRADERGTSPFLRLVSHADAAHRAHGADQRGTLWRESRIRITRKSGAKILYFPLPGLISLTLSDTISTFGRSSRSDMVISK